MSSTFQTKGQSILQHGESVWHHTQKLLSQDFAGFRMPMWFILYKEQLLNHCYDWDIIKTYNIYHDIGKPFCRIVDENGKQHFPNHAQVSYETWMSISDDKTIGNLILHDMDCHTLKFDEYVKQKLSIQDTCTLLITALAELHSNAALFDGIEGTSFKIKFKHLDKLGRRLCQHMFPALTEENEPIIEKNTKKKLEICHV